MNRPGLVAALLLVLISPVLRARADDLQPEGDVQVYEETPSDRLIEMSIVLGRLERLRADLKSGHDLSLEDLRTAVGKARGPQQRLLAETQALELLRSRLEMLRADTPGEEAPLPLAAPRAEEEPAAPERPLAISGALQVMGPPVLPENSRALGDILREAGHYTLALDSYRRIPTAERTPWDRFHMAICLERLGRLTRARAEYRAVAVEAKGEPLGEHARWVANTYLGMLVATMRKSAK